MPRKNHETSGNRVAPSLPTPGTTPYPPYLAIGPDLMHQMARAFWAFKQAYAAEVGISAVELGILSYLSMEDGLTQQELTTRLRVDPSMITRAVKEMERAQSWITRARDERDNRLMRVYLTDAGRQRAVGLPERAAAVEARLTGALSDEERRQLGRLLQKIERSIHDAPQPPGSDNDD